MYYLSPINLTYAWSFGSATGICFVIPILSGIFLAMYYLPHISSAFSMIDAKFFSYLMCEAPEAWEISLAKSGENFFSPLVLDGLIVLSFGLTVFLGYLIRRFYRSKKRRTVLTVVLDHYIELLMRVLNGILPRRFMFFTLSLGSFVVRQLYAYHYISVKSAVVLAFVVPSVSFFFF